MTDRMALLTKLKDYVESGSSKSFTYYHKGQYCAVGFLAKEVGFPVKDKVDLDDNNETIDNLFHYNHPMVSELTKLFSLEELVKLQRFNDDITLSKEKTSEYIDELIEQEKSV